MKQEKNDVTFWFVLAGVLALLGIVSHIARDYADSKTWIALWGWGIGIGFGGAALLFLIAWLTQQNSRKG